MRRFFTNGLFLFAVLAFAAEESPAWRLALPGWKYEFPRDHHAHPEFKTEWWYLTGNLEAEDGRQFGYQLTFFRQGVRRGEKAQTRFAVDDIKLAHFAITDIGEGKFRHAQKVSRGSFGEAGFSDGNQIAWIDDWELRLVGDGKFAIEAKEKDFALKLDLHARKPAVIHGENGISQKSAGEGRASHYYSFTRLESTGTMTLAGEQIPVRGWSWFDQEWASNQLTEEQTGWDWFSAQFDDGSELMLFQLRLRQGGRDPYSHGTWIGTDGQTVAVKNNDFELLPGRAWKSDETGGEYPVEWRLKIPKLGLQLDVVAAMDSQELVLKPIAYWEGSVRVSGSRNGEATSGRGYLEMTGYAGGIVGLQAPETR